MSKQDDQFILDAWQTLTENLLEVNKTLSELVEEQHEQILKLSTTQTVKPKLWDKIDSNMMPSQSEKDKE